MGVTMEQLFAEVKKTQLTAPIPTVIRGKGLKGVNELPLISQSVANVISTIAWGISSPKGASNVQKTIQLSVNRRYLPFINAMAVGNRKSFHHLYEWNSVGRTSQRLFDLKVINSGRSKSIFSMEVSFRPSHTLVPLTEAQATPGPTGEVVKRKHIFYNKAMVMEYGQRVTIRPKTSKYLAFDTPPTAAYKSASGLTFTSNPITINYASRSTAYALRNATETFFSGYGQNKISDGLDEYTHSLKRSAAKSSHLLEVSVPSDAYATMVAKKVTAALTAKDG